MLRLLSKRFLSCSTKQFALTDIIKEKIMASNGHTHEVILVNPTSDNFADEVTNIHSHPTKLIIHTGNIATWNSLKSRKTQIPASEVLFMFLGNIFC